MLTISNDKGITSAHVLNYGTLPHEFRPITNITKWVVLRENVSAYLEIRVNGEVILSRANGTIASGIWLVISEAYI
ncbi:hypothetical protein [Faecalicatena contorta]|uniref:Uncharacterized protein n=1 Tax=Faecalicatena contorta TaxID=39482 RepID=A0A315ZWU5_9FIRM|nr:hypothetical protein [Faecalicatena contorta]PWJ49360.1 hypothetical protein A8805_10757 [Faecalicatena contorta]SUQ14604.1 hypothetical protein SAMN05216529_10757 [Faecalicatena contorta]